MSFSEIDITIKELLARPACDLLFNLDEISNIGRVVIKVELDGEIGTLVMESEPNGLMTSRETLAKKIVAGARRKNGGKRMELKEAIPFLRRGGNQSITKTFTNPRNFHLVSVQFGRVDYSTDIK